MGFLNNILIQRSKLSKIFDDARDVQAYEQMQETVAGSPDEIAAAQATASDGQTKVNALKATPQFLVLALTGLLANERRLVGGTGVAITDGGANGNATIEIDTVTDLGYTPANKAGDTFSGAVDVQAALRCDSLRIDQAAAASVATVTHSVPINLNGTTYYILLSTTP
jgi:hypothetical protein